MASDRITKKTVDALRPGTADRVYWDDKLKGFGVRVRPSGAKSFIALYRIGGRNAPLRKVTLGTVGKITAEEAREEARMVLARAELGHDTAAERAKLRADITVRELADLYLAEGCDHKKPSSVANDRSRIKNHIKPLLGGKTAGALTAIDIEKAMREIAAGKTAADTKTVVRGRSIVRGGRGAATQTILLLSAILSFAVKRGVRPDNPASGVEKFATRRVERFLTTTELQALGAALREAETVGISWEPDQAKKVRHAPKPENRRIIVGPHATAAIRLLVLTGARLREILHLQWGHVDFERGLLLLPDSKTGKKTIVLNAPALAILADLPRIGGYVIAAANAGRPLSPGNKERPRADLKRPWQLITRRAGFTGVRLHDLRHTHASFGAGAGLGLPIIGKLLGQSQPATTARYAHLDADPLRKAANRIAGDIARAMGEAPQASGEVIAINRARSSPIPENASR